MVYTIEEIKSKIQPIAEKYNLKTVYLFGSYARGEADEMSDVDVAVDLSEDSDYFRIYCDLMDLFDENVDVLPLSSLLNPETNVGMLVKRNFMNERVQLL